MVIRDGEGKFPSVYGGSAELGRRGCSTRLFLTNPPKNSAPPPPLPREECRKTSCHGNPTLQGLRVTNPPGPTPATQVGGPGPGAAGQSPLEAEHIPMLLGAKNGSVGTDQQVGGRGGHRRPGRLVGPIQGPQTQCDQQAEGRSQTPREGERQKQGPADGQRQREPHIRMHRT